MRQKVCPTFQGLGTVISVTNPNFRKSGLLSVLATDHPMGDFKFCHYRWSIQEQHKFLSSDLPSPPKTVDQLPPCTPSVPIYYYARDLETTSAGPNLTEAQFRRLNSCRNNRLVVWNLWGPDSLDRVNPLVVIPSEDLCPTQAQRDLFANNLTKNKAEEFTDRTPLLSNLLTSGLFAAEYGVGCGGPLTYDGHSWGQIWEFFHKFTRCGQFQHPLGRIRDPASFRYPLWKLNERLAREDAQKA
jgi:hypothetical protein